ncbi:MAG: hypothetical protein WBZ36_02505 [Candidatus Nitrosopolaris sp.]|jgi:hypothetical protein
MTWTGDIYRESLAYFERINQQYRDFTLSIQRINELYNQQIKLIEGINQAYNEFFENNKKVNELYKQHLEDLQRLSLQWLNLFWRPLLGPQKE